MGKPNKIPNQSCKSQLIVINQVLQWAADHNIHPQALSFSNANGSLFCLDSKFKPIRPGLTYLDMRASQQAQALIETYGRAHFRSSATPIHATYWPSKFLWMRQTGWISSECRYFCTIKDLLVTRLTGQFTIDYSNAVATGMANVETGNWDEGLLDAIGITINQLPKILPDNLSTRNFNPWAKLPYTNPQKGSRSS